jgi:predicted NAD/FAD-binding protein
MICAHYLAQQHQVTVIEREPILGGNIRTLNGNVEADNIPPELFVDNGVIEFHRDHSPALHSLMRDLGLQLEPIDGGSTSVYLENGRSFHMPWAIRAQDSGTGEKLLRYAQLARVLLHLIPIRLRMGWRRQNVSGDMGRLLGKDPMSNWIRMLLMYAYSMPFQQIDQFPARLAIPTLVQGGIGTDWVRLRGGSYRYIQEIVDRAGPILSIQTGVTVAGVTRSRQGVSVRCADEVLQADKVVFATPPDQVAALLADADEQETRWFGSWRENSATTVIHTDTSIYSRWGKVAYTEFDLFQKENGADAGYNAYLNRLCGLPEDHATRYFLAYNMEDRIDPDKILHRQRHRTPLYTTDAHRHIDAIKAANGRNNTFFAGAYLYNGLHEGAARSAVALRALLVAGQG